MSCRLRALLLLRALAGLYWLWALAALEALVVLYPCALLVL
jgi:hypothetical protein